MNMKKARIGVIGCGNISDIYLKNSLNHEILEVSACSDLIRERAEEKSQKYSIPRTCQTEELLNDPDIDIVLNLTTPPYHAEICLSALNAGKHVYVEKPLALSRKDGQKILQTARENGLLVGSAPDTFMGAGIQTCRRLIDEGRIGDLVGANAFMMGHGHENWHPDPAFYYQPGGGPMFDMGPYYLTALVSLMGPVKRVTGSTGMAFKERTITSQARFGEKIKVKVPTHVTGLLDFENGAIGCIITSFDVWKSHQTGIEIYGTLGSLEVPDPNAFKGPVKIFRPEAGQWEVIPLKGGPTGNARGIGLADMAHALNAQRAHRANGEMAFHVLDIMHGIHEASVDGKHIQLKSRCKRPEPSARNIYP